MLEIADGFKTHPRSVTVPVRWSPIVVTMRVAPAAADASSPHAAEIDAWVRHACGMNGFADGPSEPRRDQGDDR